jgi:protein TonB
MTKLKDLEDDEPGFFRRNLVMIVLISALLGGGAYAATHFKPSKSSPKKKMDMVMVMPIAPPPPPPPPLPPKEEPPPPEEKEEEEMAAEEEPPPDAQDKPADKPSEEPLGTAITGNGPGDGLGIGGGIGGRGGIGGTGGKAYSERGRWQGKFARSIQDILSSHPDLKFAKGSFPIRVWLDESGRVTSVVLNGTTGNAAYDETLKNRALASRVLEPAPPGTVMPVILRFTGR